MTTFVLVHGAWNGAHGFRFVRPILLAAGHEVFTPSLTGIGERVHLAHSGINLSTHIRDVVNTILYEISSTSAARPLLWRRDRHRRG